MLIESESNTPRYNIDIACLQTEQSRVSLSYMNREREREILHKHKRSLSITHLRLPSNGIPPGLNGVLPVAINTFSAFNVVIKLSESVTNKELDPPESANAAVP